MTTSRTMLHALMPVAFIGLVLGPLASVSSAAPTVTRYSLTDLGTLGGIFSFGQEINNEGQLVGDYFVPQPKPSVFHAFVWQEGDVTQLPTLGVPGTFAAAINARGDITGNVLVPKIPAQFPSFCIPNRRCHAVLWHKEEGPDGNQVDGGQTLTIRDLGTLGGEVSAGLDLTDSDQVVGFSEITARDPRGGQAFSAFLWDKGVMKNLGHLGTGVGSQANAINNAGEVAGWSYVNTTNDPNVFSIDVHPVTPDYHAFLWRHGSMIDLGTLGGPTSVASDIGNDGRVVGFAATPRVDPAAAACGFSPKNPVLHAAQWQHGTVSDLGTLPGELYSFADATNTGGQVVGGGSTIWCENNRALIWQHGTVTDLNTVIPVHSSLTLQEAFGINDRGQITGIGLTANGTAHAFLLTPTEEGEANPAGSQGVSTPTQGSSAQDSRCAIPYRMLAAKIVCW